MEHKHILMAEDDANDVLLIQRAFRKAGLGYNLMVVNDGQQAIDYLAGQGDYGRRGEFPFPFLVLLDLKMPGVDGFDVLRWVRSEPSLKRLLVVVLTSSASQVDVDRAYELGANSYMVKPVQFEDLVSLIQRFEIYWSEITRLPSAVAATSAIQPGGSLR